MKYIILIISLLSINSYSQCPIDRKVDKFNGEIRLSTPILKSGTTVVQPVRFIKYITASDTSFYLSLTTYGNTVVVDGKGATILFADGYKLDYNSEEIDVEASNGMYEYSAFISVGVNTMNILSNRMIDGFKLYIFDRMLNANEKQKSQTCATAILSAN